jgi:hypothetical protein
LVVLHGVVAVVRLLLVVLVYWFTAQIDVVAISR